MKVQIIQLDAHDDPISARDKLGWVKAPRAVLVWPQDGTPLRRQLDLVLLKRRAAQLNFQLGLVAHDPLIRDHAQQVGLPVFESIEALPETGWRRSRADRRRTIPLRQPRPVASFPTRMPVGVEPSKSSSIRILALSLAAASWVVLVGLLLPWTEVAAAPEITRRTIDVELLLATSANPDTLAGQVPARRLTIQVDAAQQALTTGRVAIPSTRADGIAQLTNLTSEAIHIPAGTGLRTADPEGPRFRTLETHELPAVEGASIEAPIEALEPGKAGNVAAGELTSIEGALGLQIQVTNPQPLRGGRESIHLGVSEADAHDLEIAVLNELEAKALQGLAEALGENEQLSPEGMRVLEIQRMEFDHAIGEATGRLSLYMQVSFETLAYRVEEYESALENLLLADRGADWKSVPGSLRVEIRSARWLPAGGLALRIEGAEEVFADRSLGEIQQSLRGATPQSVSRILREQFDLRLVQIRLFPGWLPRLPLLGSRIHILFPWETKS